MSLQHDGATLRIWDIWIRTFHWAFAGAVLFLLLSGETGFQFFEWHKRIGELVLLLLLFRFIWGFVGSSNARLLSLVKHPREAVSHLLHLIKGQVPQERGHNAAGGWAVVIMLLLVSFQAISGLFIADEDELIEGTFYGLLDSSLSEELLHLHHLNAQLLMLLVGIHVLMILIYWLRARQNLLMPMITGKFRSTTELPAVKFESNARGLVIFVLCFALIAALLKWF